MERQKRYPYQPKTVEEEAAAERAVARYMERYRSHLINEVSKEDKFAALAITSEGIEVSCGYRNTVLNANFEFGVLWSDLTKKQGTGLYTLVEDNDD